MIRVLLSLLVFLFPLGAYCFLLGRVHRRRHPSLVPGVQDCAGLLLAVSGFFLVVWPSILTGFHYRLGDVWLYYHYNSPPGWGHRWGLVGWALLWLMYGTVVIGGVAWMLGRRRGVSVVYNVEPAAFGAALGQALDRLGLAWTRAGREIRVGSRHSVKGTSHETLPAPHHVPWAARVLAHSTQPDEAGRPRPPLQPDTDSAARDGDVLLAVESWAAMRHVTLSWAPGRESLRREIEAELKDVLAHVWTPEHPVGMWFQTASALLFILMFFLTVLYQYLNLLGGRVGL